MHKRERERRREDRIKLSRPIPSAVRRGGVEHVDRKRRLPRIAEIHVEAGGKAISWEKGAGVTRPTP